MSNLIYIHIDVISTMQQLNYYLLAVVNVLSFLGIVFFINTVLHSPLLKEKLGNRLHYAVTAAFIAGLICIYFVSDFMASTSEPPHPVTVPLFVQTLFTLTSWGTLFYFGWKYKHNVLGLFSLRKNDIVKK
jgi:hypothetical protein